MLAEFGLFLGRIPHRYSCIIVLESSNFLTRFRILNYAKWKSAGSMAVLPLILRSIIFRVY